MISFAVTVMVLRGTQMASIAGKGLMMTSCPPTAGHEYSNKKNPIYQNQGTIWGLTALPSTSIQLPPTVFIGFHSRSCMSERHWYAPRVLNRGGRVHLFCTPRVSRKVESSMWEMKLRWVRSHDDRSSTQVRPKEGNTGKNYTKKHYSALHNVNMKYWWLFKTNMK